MSHNRFVNVSKAYKKNSRHLFKTKQTTKITLEALITLKTKYFCKDRFYLCPYENLLNPRRFKK